MIDRLLFVYIVASLLGILFELTISGGKHHCLSGNPKSNCFLSATVFNVYGWGAVLLYSLIEYINPETPSDNLLVLVLCIIAISLFECIAGQISLAFYKEKTWNYDNAAYTFCSGYVSLKSIFTFTVPVVLYLGFRDHIKN